MLQGQGLKGALIRTSISSYEVIVTKKHTKKACQKKILKAIVFTDNWNEWLEQANLKI